MSPFLTRLATTICFAAWISVSPCMAQGSKSVDLNVQDIIVSDQMIDISLEPRSRITLAEFTRGAIGRKVDIRIDNEVVMSPVITEVIVDGRLRVTGIAAASLAHLRGRVHSGQARIQIELSKS